MLLAARIVYAFAMLSIKLSILLLYFRIFNVSKTMRWMIYIGIYTQILFYLTYIATYVTLDVVCISGNTLTKLFCTNTWIIVEVAGSINVATELFILALPTVMVWQLQLTFRRKLGVISVFMAGLV